MIRFISLALLPVALLVGCARHPSIKSDVDLEKLISAKSQVPPDKDEAIPSTYFELTAWTGDDTRNPPTVISNPGTINAKSQIACVSATGCQLTLPSGTYTLKTRQAITANSAGHVTLSCAGNAPALCKAVVVN